MYAKKEKINPAYVSKHNSNYEKQVILMISNREKLHYLAVKKISTLLRGIIESSKNNGGFYCLNCLDLNCLNSFRTKSKLESHKRDVKIKICVM